MKHALSKAELNRIRDAVARAEARTSGEIVPYVVARSASHEIAIYRGTLLLGVMACFVVFLIEAFHVGWRWSWLSHGTSQALLIAGAGIVGASIAMFLPAARRSLVGKARLAHVVRQRALAAFVEKEVFCTRERTGIMLLVSLFERRIQVIGDSGINQKVNEDDWSGIVDKIRDGIRSGDLAGGMVAGIEMAGQLLERSGVEIRPDDTNELANEVTQR